METKNLGREDHRKAIEAELFTEKLFIDIIHEGQKKGAFREVDTGLLGPVIKAMLQDWYLKRWKYAGRKVSVERYAAFVVEFVEMYLAPSQE
jgi:hypothetical protein